MSVYVPCQTSPTVPVIRQPFAPRNAALPGPSGSVARGRLSRASRTLRSLAAGLGGRRGLARHHVEAGPEIAFAYGLLRCGTPADLEANPDNRLRVTVGLRNIDGEWKAQKLSEQDYTKTFAAADERYARILAALLAQLKQST